MWYQARRYFAWAGNPADRVFLSWNELGSPRETPEAAFEDVARAPDPTREHPHYGREYRDVVVVVAPQLLIDS